jgi:excisionase family DNA binding protein
MERTMAGSAEDFLEDLIERIAARVIERMPQPQARAPATPPAEYLKTSECAKLLGVGSSTLELWRAKGTGPAYAKLTDAGGSVRYSRAAIDDYLAKRARKTK